MYRVFKIWKLKRVVNVTDLIMHSIAGLTDRHCLSSVSLHAEVKASIWTRSPSSCDVLRVEQTREQHVHFWVQPRMQKLRMNPTNVEWSHLYPTSHPGKRSSTHKPLGTHAAYSSSDCCFHISVSTPSILSPSVRPGRDSEGKSGRSHDQASSTRLTHESVNILNLHPLTSSSVNLSTNLALFAKWTLSSPDP